MTQALILSAGSKTSNSHSSSGPPEPEGLCRAAITENTRQPAGDHLVSCIDCPGQSDANYPKPSCVIAHWRAITVYPSFRC